MVVIKHNRAPAGPRTQSGKAADLNILKTLLSGRSDVRKIHWAALIFSANTLETKIPQRSAHPESFSGFLFRGEKNQFFFLKGGGVS